MIPELASVRVCCQPEPNSSETLSFEPMFITANFVTRSEVTLFANARNQGIQDFSVQKNDKCPTLS